MSVRRDRAPGWTSPEAARGLGPEVEGRLARYFDMVTRWNSSQDLVSRNLDAGRFSSLVGESLAGLPHVPENARFLDVGSGVGIPAIPLLLARSDLQAVLLEARERRWAFLREVVRELDVAAEVRRGRLGELDGVVFGAMTVRGVGPEVWRCDAARLVSPGGVVVWWTSESRGREAGLGDRVLICPALGGGRGALVVWSPCST